MIFPFGKETDKWYIASKFGVQRDGYIHSGADYNLKTGGDTDLDEPLYATSSGQITYYHFASHPNSGFGRHQVHKIEGPWGVRWIHYAHCSERDFINSRQNVEEGEMIARVGKSGTKYAHLHCSVFKIDPSQLPYGIDTIATSKTMLDSIWEDPEEFFKNYYNTMPQQEDIRLKLLNDAGIETEGDLRAVLGSHKDIDNVKQDLQNTKKELERLQGEYGDLEDDYERDVKAYESRITEADKQLNDFIATLAKITGAGQSTQAIVEEVTRSVSDADKKEEKRQEAIDNQEQRQSMEQEVERLREALESEREANELLEGKVKDLIATVTTLERKLSINEKDKMAEKYPIWKKALWDAWRAFGVAFLSVIVIRLESGISLDKPIDWLLNVLAAALAGGFSALARLLREDKDYQNLLYKLPF